MRNWQSDVVINGGSEKQWKAHAVVVCSQSKVFKQAIKAEWQVSKFENTRLDILDFATDVKSLTQKTKQNVLDLSDEPDHLIEQLIRFLYNDDDYKTPEIAYGPMQLNTKMFIAGDKYDVPDLCEYASHKLLAEMPNVNFKDPTIKQDFLNTVYELYQDAPATADYLRGELIVAGISHSRALFEDDFKKDDEGKEEDLTFHQLVRDIPEFGDQVMLALSEAFAENKANAVGTRTCRCDTCRTQFVMTHGQLYLKVHCPHCKLPARNLWD